MKTTVDTCIDIRMYLIKKKVHFEKVPFEDGNFIDGDLKFDDVKSLQF